MASRHFEDPGSTGRKVKLEPQARYLVVQNKDGEEALREALDLGYRTAQTNHQFTILEGDPAEVDARVKARADEGKSWLEAQDQSGGAYGDQSTPVLTKQDARKGEVENGDVSMQDLVAMADQGGVS